MNYYLMEQAYNTTATPDDLMRNEKIMSVLTDFSKFIFFFMTAWFATIQNSMNFSSQLSPNKHLRI